MKKPTLPVHQLVCAGRELSREEITRLLDRATRQQDECRCALFRQCLRHEMSTAAQNAEEDGLITSSPTT